MLSSLRPPNKEVDVEFLVFVERYATDLLKWDILTYFGKNPNACASVLDIAQDIGRGAPSIRPELGDLTLRGILDQVQVGAKKDRMYQLTQNSNLRRLTVKFAKHQSAENN